LRLGYFPDPTIYTNNANKQGINHTLTTGIGLSGKMITINLGLEWRPASYEAGYISNIIPGIQSKISKMTLESQILLITFDLFVRIT
jgi:hypothetical protein